MADESAPPTNDTNVTPQEATSAIPQIHRIVIDGKEEEVDTETALRHYGLHKASYKRFQEASAKEKAVQQQLAELEGDDDAVFRYLRNKGKDPVKAAERLILEEMRKAQLSPEETRREQLAAEVRQLEEQREAARQEYEQYQLQQEAVQHYHSYAQALPQAALAAGLPAELHSMAVPMIARKMEDALINGYDLPPAEAAREAQQEIVGMVRHLATTLSPARLAELLGPSTMQALRTHDVSAVRGVPKEARVPQRSEQRQPTPGRRHKKTWSEVFGDD